MGLFFREIAAFAGIVFDVEEIFVVGDLQVFPTTAPYRALVAVTHAPIERAFEFLLSHERWAACGMTPMAGSLPLFA